MNFLLMALSLAAAVFRMPVCIGIDDASQQELTITVVPGKDKAGSPCIDRNEEFEVVFTNSSDKPIRLWSENCQPGYECLSFAVENKDGHVSRMHKRSPHPGNWRNKPPQTITIPPQGSFSAKVAPYAIWGDREWKGVPEPDPATPVILSAIFEISPTDATKEHGVWTGRIESEPITTLVVDPTLQTPEDFMYADCPKNALRMIQADRSWVNKPNDSRETLLHVAARRGFTEIADWLISNGAEINATAYNQFTPLHMAREPAMIRLLVNNKANINATAVSGTVLQQIAHEYAHMGELPGYEDKRDELRSIANILLDAGAEYDILSACYLGDVERVGVLATDKAQASDKKAMREAARYGQAEIVELLLKNGADPEDADYEGLTVSYFAIKHPEVLKLLFDAGADPKVKVSYDGNGNGPQNSTLLHEAVSQGAVESVKLLLTKGLSVDSGNPDGYSPLCIASMRGDPEMVVLLLQSGADANVRAKDGLTPMYIAASQIRPEHEDDNAQFAAVIRELAREGAEIDLFAAIATNDIERVTKITQANPKAGEEKNATGRPALHRAVTLDRLEILKLFLDEGCDPDVCSDEPWVGHERETALLQAAFWGRLEAAELLIHHGASVNAASNRGVTPLHEAARMGQLDIVRLLLKHGGNAAAKDDKDRTPLDWAHLYQEVPEIIELLRNSSNKDPK